LTNDQPEGPRSQAALFFCPPGAPTKINPVRQAAVTQEPLYRSSHRCRFAREL